MIILMNKKAERNQINLVMETLKKQNLIPIYIEKENAISTIKTNLSVDISSQLIMNLPGIERVIESAMTGHSRIVN